MKKIVKFIRVFISHSVVKNSAVVMSGSMVSNILAYLYHVVVGRILGPQQYGELAALISLFYILNVPSTVVQTILTKFFSVLRATNKPGEVKHLSIHALKIMVTAAIIGVVVVAISVDAVSSFLRINSKVNFYWLYFMFALYFIGIVPLSITQAYQKFLAQSVLSAIGMTLRLVFAALAAPFGVAMILMSNVVANIISLVTYALPLKFLFRIKATTLTLSRKRTIGYSVPTFITTLAIAALYNQDVLLVKHFFTSADAGIYSSLSVLGKVIFYTSSAITFVLFPVIAERKELKRSHTRLVGASLISVASLSLILTIIYFLFPTFIVHMLYGASYDAAVPYVGIFGVFISFFALDNIMFSICLAAEKVGVWVFGLLAGIAQFGAIWLYHGTIQTVITANIFVAATLFVTLLVYYTHAPTSE